MRSCSRPLLDGKTGERTCSSSTVASFQRSAHSEPLCRGWGDALITVRSSGYLELVAPSDSLDPNIRRLINAAKPGADAAAAVERIGARNVRLAAELNGRASRMPLDPSLMLAASQAAENAAALTKWVESSKVAETAAALSKITVPPTVIDQVIVGMGAQLEQFGMVLAKAVSGIRIQIPTHALEALQQAASQAVTTNLGSESVQQMTEGITLAQQFAALAEDVRLYVPASKAKAPASTPAVAVETEAVEPSRVVARERDGIDDLIDAMRELTAAVRDSNNGSAKRLAYQTTAAAILAAAFIAIAENGGAEAAFKFVKALIERAPDLW